MRIHPAPQGSGEWLLARSTILTASNLSKVLTPAKLEVSAQAAGIARQCAAARVFGVYEDTVSSPAMERGSEMEAEARLAYEMLSGYRVREVGLCLTDDGLFGASPDGLIDECFGLEIKCPKLPQSLDNLLAEALPIEYSLQIQAGIYVTGREGWKWVSYYPGLPVAILHVSPDPRVQEAIALAVPKFEALVLEYVAKFEALK